jgi:excisionase family DNA binding protein
VAYLNVQRAALRLGVAPHTVRRWTASGLPPCARTAGGHRRIREEDVDALAQQIRGSTHLEARRGVPAQSSRGRRHFLLTPARRLTRRRERP